MMHKDNWRGSKNVRERESSERRGEQEEEEEKRRKREEKTGQLPFQSTVSKRLLSPLYAGTFKARREKRNCCYYSNYWRIELNELYMTLLVDALNECRCRQVLPFVHTNHINTHTHRHTHDSKAAESKKENARWQQSIHLSPSKEQRGDSTTANPATSIDRVRRSASKHGASHVDITNYRTGKIFIASDDLLFNV